MPSKTPADRQLTALQEAFCQLVAISGLKLGDAYLEAGYAEPKSRQKLWELASTLRRHLQVSARIDALRAAAAEDRELERTWIIEQLRANALDARAALDYGPANKALELIGRELFGMFVLRKEVGKPGAFNALTPDELRKRIADELRKRGISEAALAALLLPGRRGVSGSP